MEIPHINVPLKNLGEFVRDPEKNIYVHPDNCIIDYQDGGEAYILESMKKIHDLSSHSFEFRKFIKDWPSQYHFSNKRTNFLEALQEVLPMTAAVLEIGSGCGTITRWLGEKFRSVDALEGNAQRAVITRYRTHDLDNVEIYCGDLLATGFDKKYDIITLIGSLEYLPLYDTEHDNPKDASFALLNRLRGALKDDGILLVAIENKFGAKYFSGCKEDHTGREFEGLIGYPEKTPVTFSRNELESMLARSGFGHNQFYHVFPDYKLTDTIIPENPEVLSLYPYNWVRTPFENYTGNRLNLFPDFLFLKSITDSGLLWQFSNSFVIVASPTQTINLAVQWLIEGYRNSENLIPAFHHKITLIRNPDPEIPEKKYLVQRSLLPYAFQTDCFGSFEFRLLNNTYISGELLIYDFYTSLFRSNHEEALKKILNELHNWLLDAYPTFAHDPEGYALVKGEAIDYTFWNIIVEPHRAFNFIDRKWNHTNPLPADLILFRNLFNIFEKCGPYLKIKNKRSFILEMIRSIYPQYSEMRLSAALEFERVFQAYASGRPQNFTMESSVHESIADKLTQNVEMAAKVESLNQSLTDRFAEIQEMTSVIASRDRYLAEREKLLKAQTIRSEELERAVVVGNKQITKMSENITMFEHQVQEQIARIHTLEQEITSIERSIIWQLTMKFHVKVVERLLPQKTRRRKYYELGRTGGQILIQDGITPFNQSVTRHFHKNNELNDYPNWIKKNEPVLETLNRLKEISHDFSYRPKISIITPVWNTDEKWLRIAIESVISQVYDNWELCIVDGGSTKRHIKQILKEYAKKDPRIKIKFLEDNLGISGNSNEALALVTGEFIGFLDHDDELASFALYEVVTLLNKKQNVDFIYSDEDKIDQKGKRKDPFFKPDWSPDLFLSQNYLCHFSVIRKTLIDSVCGFREGYDGSQDYDLFLRCTEKISPKTIAHIPKILYHWRTIQGSAAGHIVAKPYAIVSAKKALSDSLYRSGQTGDVSDGFSISSYRIRYAIKNTPRVSIIIPTKDHVEILKRCVQSILGKTEYQNYEIVIVDNQSVEENTFEYYKSLNANSKIKILHYNKPFNFSAINNYAVGHVNSPYILFLNNDTEVITEEWLSAMLEHAQRDGVGAVGAKLLYPNNLIQHAGVILGITGTPGQKGVAGHSHKYLPNNFTGYFLRSQIIGNYSAVTAACLMMRKNIFQEIGGFNEDLAIAFNDVDLCLKIRQRGYLIVYSPYAQLYHYESTSRGYENTPEKQVRFFKEVTLIREQWGVVIDSGDPYYNPNLTLEREDFSIKN